MGYHAQGLVNFEVLNLYFLYYRIDLGHLHLERLRLAIMGIRVFYRQSLAVGGLQGQGLACFKGFTIGKWKSDQKGLVIMKAQCHDNEKRNLGFSSVPSGVYRDGKALFPSSGFILVL